MSLSAGGATTPRQAVVDWALSQVGVAENAAASEFDRPQSQTRIDAWQREFGLNGAEWCGCFVGYALRAIGGVKRIDGRVAWIPCVLADARAGVSGWVALIPPSDAIGGDAALYCWDDTGVPGHIGLVVANYPDDAIITAVEGNTTSGDHGDQAHGGGVFRRERAYGTIVACAVPRYPSFSGRG
jgi:hypothetical protein